MNDSEKSVVLLMKFADLILDSDASDDQKEAMKIIFIELSGIIGGAFGSIAAYEQILRELKSTKKP